MQYLRRADTPFLSEASTPDFSNVSPPTEQEVSYVEAKLRTVINSGEQCLKSYAAKVLMKVLYAARYARFDLLRAVCFLAQYITKWDTMCDKRLYRLMCYINSTYHLRLTGWVGDSPLDVAPHLFADADFAGDSKTSRSCSGVHLCLLGPNTVFPLAGQCKKQGCVSPSKPEAEVVAADHAMRSYGLPCLDLCDKLLDFNFMEILKPLFAQCATAIRRPLGMLSAPMVSALGGLLNVSPIRATTFSMSALLCRRPTSTRKGSQFPLSEIV